MTPPLPNNMVAVSMRLRDPQKANVDDELEPVDPVYYPRVIQPIYIVPPDRLVEKGGLRPDVPAAGQPSTTPVATVEANDAGVLSAALLIFLILLMSCCCCGMLYLATKPKGQKFLQKKFKNWAEFGNKDERRPLTRYDSFDSAEEDLSPPPRKKIRPKVHKRHPKTPVVTPKQEKERNSCDPTLTIPLCPTGKLQAVTIQIDRDGQCFQDENADEEGYISTELDPFCDSSLGIHQKNRPVQQNQKRRQRRMDVEGSDSESEGIPVDRREPPRRKLNKQPQVFQTAPKPKPPTPSSEWIPSELGPFINRVVDDAESRENYFRSLQRNYNYRREMGEQLVNNVGPLPSPRK